jgi:hypothetical protein
LVNRCILILLPIVSINISVVIPIIKSNKLQIKVLVCVGYPGQLWAIPNNGKKPKRKTMKNLSDHEAGELKGGTAVSQCAYNIAFSASFGGLFGGAGAVVGAVAAATGPSCLGLW